MTAVSILILFIVIENTISISIKSLDDLYKFFTNLEYAGDLRNDKLVKISKIFNTILICFGLISAFSVINQYLYLVIAKYSYMLTLISSIIVIILFLFMPNKYVAIVSDKDPAKIKKYIVFNYFLSIFINGTIYIIISNMINTIK